MKSEKPEGLEEAVELGKTFIEWARWMEIGPARKWNREDELYLLCMGSHSDMNLNLTSLSKVFSEQASVVHERLERLQKQGYITSEPSLDDARQKYFRLTDKGKKEYQSTCLFLYWNSKQIPIHPQE